MRDNAKDDKVRVEDRLSRAETSERTAKGGRTEVLANIEVIKVLAENPAIHQDVRKLVRDSIGLKYMSGGIPVSEKEQKISQKLTTILEKTTSMKKLTPEIQVAFNEINDIVTDVEKLMQEAALKLSTKPNNPASPTPSSNPPTSPAVPSPTPTPSPPPSPAAAAAADDEINDIEEDDEEEEDEAADEDDNDEDEDDPVIPVDDDERNKPGYLLNNYVSVGVIHLPSAEDVYTSKFDIQNINKDTKPNQISDSLIDEVNRVLNNHLNLQFRLQSTTSDDPATYTLQKENPRNVDSSAYVKIDFHNTKNKYLLRLVKSCPNFNSIKFYDSENVFNFIISDDFNRVNPFTDIFEQNLPLIVVPVNAGPTNSYFTGLGETSSLGIIERNGRVRDAVYIYMRPARKERFFLNFYTTDLYKKYFDFPSLLYLHFLIEPVN